MTILIIAEHDHTHLQPNIFNMVQAAKDIQAGFGIETKIEVALFGADCENFAQEAAKVEAVDKVLYFKADKLSHVIAEDAAPLLQNIASNYTHILLPSSTFGKNLMPRLAGLLDVAALSDVMGIEGTHFVRPIYAGNAIAHVELNEDLKLMTIRATTFDKVGQQDTAATVETIEVTDLTQDLSTYVSAELSESERPELTSAGVVVSGGRALQSKENFKLIEELADKLGAAVGASRAAVDAGYVPNDYQVGQTGKVVAPDLYIAIGISGAIQHLAGMKDSKTIVAINKDEEAPIFQVADYGLVGDLFQVIPELTGKL